MCLILAVTLTSLSMAMGRSAMAADGQFCLVSGPSPVVMAHDGLPLLDRDGEPVTLASEICLDCIIGAIALPLSDQRATPPCDSAQDLAATSYRSSSASFWLMGGHGRGPPRAA